MEKNIISNFVDYNNATHLKRQGDVIFTHPSQTKFIEDRCYISFYMLDGTPVYIKDYWDIGKEDSAIYEIVVSHVMNECGVNSVPYYPILVDNKKKGFSLSSFCQDLESIKNIEFTQAADTVTPGVRLFTKNMWDFITREGVKQYLLAFMTLECYEQLKSECVFDEITGMSDRHFGNYFFYKMDPKSKKYDGIINIDSALTWIFATKNYQVQNLAEFEINFGFFQYLDYDAVSALSLSNGSYEQRINKIKQLFDKGYLGERQAKLIKKYLDCDLPARFRKESERCGLKTNEAVVDFYSRTNEYLDKNF